MLKLTRMFGLGVLLFVVAPIAIAAYGIITGQPILADQGRGVALLITIGLAAMFGFAFYAASKIDAPAEAIAQEKATSLEGQRKSTAASKKGFAH